MINVIYFTKCVFSLLKCVKIQSWKCLSLSVVFQIKFHFTIYLQIQFFYNILLGFEVHHKCTFSKN